MNTYFKILTVALCMALGSDVYGETVKTKKGRNIIQSQNKEKTMNVVPAKAKAAEKIVISSPTYTQPISTEAAKPEYQIGLGLESNMLTADFVRKNAGNKQLTISLGYGTPSSRNLKTYSAGNPFNFRGTTIEDITEIEASAAYELRRQSKKDKTLLYHYGPAVYATNTTTKKRKIEDILKNGSVVASETNYYPDSNSIEYDIRLRLGVEVLFSRYFSADASFNVGMRETTLKIGARYIFGNKDTKGNKAKDIKKTYGGKNKK